MPSLMPDPSHSVTVEPGASGQGSAEIMGLLRRLTTELDQFTSTFAEANNLHRTDLNALSVLMDAAGNGELMSAGELSARLRLSAPATTALLDRLGRVGHVRRQRSSVDRRIVEVEMSESARALGRELFRPLGAHISAALERFTPAQLETFAQVMGSVVEATQAASAEIAAKPAAVGDR